MRFRLLIVVVAMTLAACGGDDRRGTAAMTGATADAPRGERVTCGRSEFDVATLPAAPSALSLPPGPSAAVDDGGSPAFEPSLNWKVVHQSADRVEIIRELETPQDNGRGDVRTHETRTLERLTGHDDIADGTWLAVSSGACALRIVTDGDMGAADLTLARAPSPEDTSLALIVHERACTSGRSADGRIRLLELHETADQIRVRIAVQRLEGGSQTCQASPPTPFSVALDRPIGDREVVDASVVPARPVRLE